MTRERSSSSDEKVAEFDGDNGDTADIRSAHLRSAVSQIVASILNAPRPGQEGGFVLKTSSESAQYREEKTLDMSGLNRTLQKELEGKSFPDIREKYVPFIVNQLLAIQDLVDQAAETLLTSVESIQTLAMQLDPHRRDAVLVLVTRLFEACSFQDITGQRIQKIIDAMAHIEGLVDAVRYISGERNQKEAFEAYKQKLRRDAPESTRLTGPQAHTSDALQKEINKLFDGPS